MKNKFNGLKSFIILWAGQAVSSLGSSMTSFALIVWAYRQQGTASSITWLAFCSYLPSILFSFLAGTLADKWNKKKIMLTSDFVAAMGTLAVLVLFVSGQLKIWHLYVINTLISFMNAFQHPASIVAVSLLAPKEQYARVSGMQTISSSAITILTPAFATAILSLAGLKAVLMIDLITFGVAFLSLLLFIKIPSIKVTTEKKEPFFKSCLAGLRFLLEHRAIWSLILFMSFINLLAYLTGYGILPAMILARTNDNQAALGMVSSAMGVGTLVGGLLVTLAKPAKKKTSMIFISLALSFLFCDILWCFGRSTVIWIIGAFLGHIPLPFLNASITTVMRTKVPIEMQGRVFSTRDTFQYITIPMGLALGGFLADYIFEPLMAGSSLLQQTMSFFVGSGKGSGMAVIFMITGVLGISSSLLNYRRKVFKELDETDNNHMCCS